MTASDALWSMPDPSAAAVVAWLCAEVALRELDGELRAPFASLNRHLGEWEPGTTTRLAALYEEYLPPCLIRAYDRKNTPEVAARISAVLDGIYLQFRLLERIEPHDPSVPPLPHDIAEVGRAEFQALVERTMAALTPARRAGLEEWMRAAVETGQRDLAGLRAEVSEYLG